MSDERRKDYINILPVLDEIKSDVKEIRKIINGNGKIGMAAKVETMWTASVFFIVSIVSITGKLIYDFMHGK